LEIQKILETYPQTRTIPEFEFYVTLDGNPVPVGAEYILKDASGNILGTREVTTEGILVVPAGNTARVENILAGLKFTVQETSDSAAGYTVIYSGSPDVTINSDSVSGTIILDSDVAVTVTNSENGTSLTIPVKKNISNSDDEEHKFKFKLEEVTDGDGATLVEGGMVQEVEITVTSIADGSFSLSYLEKDIASSSTTYYYRITEIQEVVDENGESSAKVNYDESIYVIEVTVTKPEEEVKAEITNMWKNGKSVTGTDAETFFTAEFTNELLADLTLQKVLSGISSKAAFEFKLLLVDPTGAPVTGTFTAIKSSPADSSEGESSSTEAIVFDESGIATVHLKANESITIQNLPYGAAWTVTEVNAEGFHTSWLVDGTGPLQSGAEVNGTLTGSNTIVCTNAATYELPNTGGTGTNLDTTGGMLLMLSAVSLLLCRYKKRRKEDFASS